MNKKPKRTFRLNIIFSYSKPILPDTYRTPFLQMLQNIAWLYRLDFATSIEHQFDAGGDEKIAKVFQQSIDDIVYLRSNSKTDIDIKTLRLLIKDLFQPFSNEFAHVNYGFQMTKALPKYPFPSHFLRFENHQYVQLHNNRQVKQMLFSYQVEPILRDLQAPSLN